MNRPSFTLTTTLGALALLAAATGIGLTQHNLQLRRELAAQQQYVQQSVSLEGLYREMVRALAEMSARHDDSALRAMLQRHGITYERPLAPQAPAPAAAATPRK